MFASTFLLAQVGLCCVTFFLGDGKKGLFILGGGALTDQGKNSIQVQLGEPLSLLGLLIGAWVTDSKAVTSPGSLLGNLWATIQIKSLICSMDDSLRPAPLRSSLGHLQAATVKEESLFPVNFPSPVQPGEQWGL